MERTPKPERERAPMRAKLMEHAYLIIAKLTYEQLYSIMEIIERQQHPPHWRQ